MKVSLNWKFGFFPKHNQIIINNIRFVIIYVSLSFAALLLINTYANKLHFGKYLRKAVIGGESNNVNFRTTVARLDVPRSKALSIATQERSQTINTTLLKINPLHQRRHDSSSSKSHQNVSKALVEEYHHNTTRLRKLFSCKKLMEGDTAEQTKYTRWLYPREIDATSQKSHAQRKSKTFSTISEEDVPLMMSDCALFKQIRGYWNTSAASREDGNFSIAHVILVHRDFEHVERLVRALYRPQHSFCIHVDAKSSDKLKDAVSSFARCFDNIYLAPHPQSVTYAHVSRLLADIECMKEILQKDKKWKYLINYAATEFPLRTNAELVEILQTMHGLNDIRETFKGRLVGRFDREYQVINGKMRVSTKRLPPPPHNLTLVKGLAYNTYSRKFLEWAFRERGPRDLLKWGQKTYSADEHYWGTLNDIFHNPHLKTPGGFPGEPERKGYITKFIIWNNKNSTTKCNGWLVHNICNFNALDLPTIVSQPHLAANKFDLTLDPVGYSCMEELLENKTLTPSAQFNIHRYEKLYFIWWTRKHKIS